MEVISLREFGRRRGVRLSAVQKAIKDGRVTAVERHGDRIVGIDFELGTAQWNANTDPEQAARSGKVLGAPGGAQAEQLKLEPAAGKQDNAPAGQAKEAAPQDKDQHGYYAARAEREKHQAKLSELEYLEAIGRLVSLDEMRTVALRRYRAIRDQVLNVPDRIAAIVAAEKDPARVHTLLTAELKRVLHELSDDAGAEAARGVAERVAA